MWGIHHPFIAIATRDLNMRKTGSIDAASASSSAEYYDRTSQSGSLDENSDITIENGTEDIDDYIEDSLSNMCDSTIENDLEDAGVETPLLADCEAGSPMRELSFDLTLDVVGSTTDHSASNAVTPTPESYAAARCSAEMPLADAASASIAATPGPPMGRLVSTSSSSSSLLVSESQRLQRAAAAVYNYRSSMACTEHEYAYIYSEDDEKVYEDLCYVTFQAKAKPEVCCPTYYSVFVSGVGWDLDLGSSRKAAEFPYKNIINIIYQIM